MTSEESEDLQSDEDVGNDVGQLALPTNQHGGQERRNQSQHGKDNCLMQPPLAESLCQSYDVTDNHPIATRGLVLEHCKTANANNNNKKTKMTQPSRSVAESRQEMAQKVLFALVCSALLTSVCLRKGVLYTPWHDVIVYCVVYSLWVTTCLPWLLINLDGKAVCLLLGVMVRLFAADLGILGWAALRGESHILHRALRLKAVLEPSLSWLSDAGYSLRFGVVVACVTVPLIKMLMDLRLPSAPLRQRPSSATGDNPRLCPSPSEHETSGCSDTDMGKKKKNKGPIKQRRFLRSNKPNKRHPKSVAVERVKHALQSGSDSNLPQESRSATLTKLSSADPIWPASQSHINNKTKTKDSTPVHLAGNLDTPQRDDEHAFGSSSYGKLHYLKKLDISCSKGNETDQCQNSDVIDQGDGSYFMKYQSNKVLSLREKLSDSSKLPSMMDDSRLVNKEATANGSYVGQMRKRSQRKKKWTQEWKQPRRSNAT